MLLDKQMSIFPVWQMATYPKWIICKSYPIVCTWLHTGHAKQPFALKGCRNPARHIFPWLPGEAVGLHTGVLTKTFAMTVLYLKTIDIFSKENRLISLYIKREKCKFVQTIYFIRSHCEFIFIWLRIRDTVLNPKKLFLAVAEAACRAVVVVLQGTVVEVFKASHNVLHL